MLLVNDRSKACGAVVQTVQEAFCAGEGGISFREAVVLPQLSLPAMCVASARAARRAAVLPHSHRRLCSQGCNTQAAAVAAAVATAVSEPGEQSTLGGMVPAADGTTPRAQHQILTPISWLSTRCRIRCQGTCGTAGMSAEANRNAADRQQQVSDSGKSCDSKSTHAIENFQCT